MAARMASADPACRFAQRAFGTENAAPGAAGQYHAEKHKRPPDPPKNELRKESEVIPDMRVRFRQRQKSGDGNKQDIDEDDGPLDLLNEALVAPQGLAQRLKPHLAHFAIKTAFGASG